jgi:hypothetical protein
MKMTALCGHIEADRRLRGEYCLHHQGEELGYRPGDEGSMHLQNVGLLLQQ